MIQFLPIKKLKGYHRNPRKITAESMARLCENLAADPKLMERRPLLCYIDEEGSYIVYAGNQRLRAAAKLGWKEIACFVDDTYDYETIRKRIVLDNKAAGEWDYDILSSDYETEELFNLGFTENELFGKDDEKKEAIPPKLKATIIFEDEKQMDEFCPKLEEFCETHDLTLKLGK